ncbi:hypothetical protein NDI39_05980 [Microcoleus sp. ZQ-A2]
MRRSRLSVRAQPLLSGAGLDEVQTTAALEQLIAPCRFDGFLLEHFEDIPEDLLNLLCPSNRKP